MSGIPELWYTRYRGQVQGPYTVSQLVQLTERGRFGRHYEVSEDAVTWRRATEIPGIFSERTPKKTRSITGSVEPIVQPVAEIETAAVTVNHDSGGAVGAPEVQWLYAVGTDRRGPVAESELRRLLQQGLVPVESLVWTEGWPEWIPAGEVPNFMEVVSFRPLGQRETSPTGQAIAGRPQGSGMATSSLILGIVGVTFLLIAIGAALGSKLGPDDLSEDTKKILIVVKWTAAVLAFPPAILAICLGHVARNATAGTASGAPGRAAALAGLILGYSTLSPLFAGGVVAIANALVSE